MGAGNSGRVRQFPIACRIGAARVSDTRHRCSAYLVLLWVALGAPAGACAGGDPANGQMRTDGYPALRYREIARIGGAAAEGPAAFGKIRGVAMFADSLLAVADEYTQRVELFTLGGRYLRSFGGRGSGPGMTEAIGRIGFDPVGGLCIWDVQLVRVTHLSSQGAVLATWHPSLSAFSQLRPTLVGFVSGCSVVFADRGSRGSAQDRPGEMPVIDTTTFTFFDGGSRPLRVLTRQQNPRAWLYSEPRFRSFQDVILGPRTHSALVGRTLWVGTSDSLKLRRFDMQGRELPTTAVRIGHEPATHEDIEHERVRREQSTEQKWKRWRSALSAGDWVKIRAAYARAVDATPASHVLPSYDAIIGASDHAVWVRETPHSSAASADWLLLRSSGAVLGSLRLPSDGTVVAGSTTLVILQARDSLDTDILRVLCVCGSDARRASVNVQGSERLIGPAGELCTNSTRSCSTRAKAGGVEGTAIARSPDFVRSGRELPRR